MKKIIVIILLFIPLITHASNFEKDASYTVCFTPGQDCTDEIVAAINNSVNAIWVQAYSFTSRPIANALVMAKQRGVQVKIILDKTARQSSTANFFLRRGIPIWIDEQPAIAHNKVMVIDQTELITGSFNFTRAAQQRNAENVLIIDDETLAKKYLANWQYRQLQSQPLIYSALPARQDDWLEEFWQWLMAWLEKMIKPR